MHVGSNIRPGGALFHPDKPEMPATEAQLCPEMTSLGERLDNTVHETRCCTVQEASAIFKVENFVEAVPAYSGSYDDSGDSPERNLIQSHKVLRCANKAYRFGSEPLLVVKTA